MGRHRAIGKNTYGFKAADGHRWTATVIWAEIEGRAEPVSLTIESIDPANSNVHPGALKHGTAWVEAPPRSKVRPVSRRVLDSFPFRTFDRYRESMSGLLRDLLDKVPHDDERKRWQKDRDATERGKPGPVGRGRPPFRNSAHFVKVASIYRREIRAGNPAPNQAIAAEFGVEPNTAAKWVMRCRQNGLLGETRRGKSGGLVPVHPPTRRATR